MFSNYQLGVFLSVLETLIYAGVCTINRGMPDIPFPVIIFACGAVGIFFCCGYYACMLMYGLLFSPAALTSLTSFYTSSHLMSLAEDYMLVFFICLVMAVGQLAACKAY